MKLPLLWYDLVPLCLFFLSFCRLLWLRKLGRLWVRTLRCSRELFATVGWKPHCSTFLELLIRTNWWNDRISIPDLLMALMCAREGSFWILCSLGALTFFPFVFSVNYLSQWHVMFVGHNIEIILLVFFRIKVDVARPALKLARAPRSLWLALKSTVACITLNRIALMHYFFCLLFHFLLLLEGQWGCWVWLDCRLCI